jgi:hypothetical protein
VSSSPTAGTIFNLLLTPWLCQERYLAKASLSPFVGGVLFPFLGFASFVAARFWRGFSLGLQLIGILGKIRNAGC